MLLIIRALLEIVVLVLRSRNDTEQQKIGEDRVIKQALLDIALRTGVARKIDQDSRDWGVNDIDERLSKYYRNEGQ